MKSNKLHKQRQKFLVVRIDEQLHNNFKIYCENHNTTMSEVVLAIIRQNMNYNSIVLFNNNQNKFIKMVDYNLRRVGNNLNQAVAGLNSLVKYLEQGFDNDHTARVIESVNTSIKEANILQENTKQLIESLS